VDEHQRRRFFGAVDAGVPGASVGAGDLKRTAAVSGGAPLAALGGGAAG
jgi:hypothetical protein